MIDYNEIADRFEKRVSECKEKLDREISEEGELTTVYRKKIEEGGAALGSFRNLDLLKREAESSLRLSRLMMERSLLEKISDEALIWLRGVDFAEEWEGKDDLRVLCGLSSLIEDGLSESNCSDWSEGSAVASSLRTVMSLLKYEFIRL